MYGYLQKQDRVGKEVRERRNIAVRLDRCARGNNIIGRVMRRSKTPKRKTVEIRTWPESHGAV